MKLQTEAITFDDLEEIWLLDDADPVEDEIVLPDTEGKEKYYVEL